MSAVGTKLDADQVIKQIYDEPKNRIRVDAEVTATIGQVQVEIDAADGDNIAISDGTNTAEVDANGGLNVNVLNEIEIEIDAADGDNIAISDGTNTAVVDPNGGLNVNVLNDLTLDIDAAGGDNIAISDGTNTLSVNANGSINVEQQNLTFATDKVDVSGSLIDIQATDLDIRDLAFATDKVDVSGSSVVVSATDLDIRNLQFANDSVDTSGSDINVINEVNIRPLDASTDSVAIVGPVSLDEPVQIAGTENGLNSGTEYGFVYNQKSQIMDSHDREEDYTYVDFGTKDQRITRIEYSSPTFTGFTVRRDFNYILDGSRYRLTTSIWSVI